MDYKKERNFIVAYDGDKMCGKYDFNTHSFIGMKGAPIKSIPKAFSRAALRAEAPENIFADAMIMIIQDGTFQPWMAVRYSNMEKCLSVGICPASMWDIADNLPKLSKEFVQYIKEECHGFYRRDTYDDFQFCKKYGKLIEGLTHSNICSFKRIMTYQKNPLQYWTPEQILKMIRKMQDEYYDDACYTVIDDIGKWQKDLYGENSVVERNIATYYHILEHLHEVWEDKNRSILLKLRNDKPCLYFETEKYTVYPLTTQEQFHDEANQQHNCVERLYMERVTDGSTNIVVVRAKDNPEKSLVTCEVHDGQIEQYLACMNKNVCDRELVELKRLYAEHLKNNWA